MAFTVNDAFLQFNADTVNLDPDRTSIARSSRDWLIEQINGFPVKDDVFPNLFVERHIKFGSFARNVKIKELDDVDLILCLHADNAYYRKDNAQPNKYKIYTTNAGHRLIECSDNGVLNSRKVINAFVSSLKDIEQYKNADIHRKLEAATLELNSYEWVFDIVPAFHTVNDFYLIPDGLGGWKATNPEVDQKRLAFLNKKYGAINQLVRTLKYWNRERVSPNVGSYLFENFVLGFIESSSELTQYVDVNMIRFWHHFKSSVYQPVLDPAGFQGNINDLTSDIMASLSKQALEAHNKGIEANTFEVTDKNNKAAISKWQEIFGTQFPSYGL